jgi:hypothetical protein
VIRSWEPTARQAVSSGSAIDGIEAYAKAYHATPERLLEVLNKEPVNKAIEFVNLAGEMPQTANGTYLFSDPHDDPDVVKDDRIPGDLKELNFWADSLFGRTAL